MPNREEFDINAWRLDQQLKELEGEDNSPIFVIDPKLAHQIWEIIIKKMKNYKEFPDDIDGFEEAFPTASGFANFLNKELKNEKK